MNHSDVGTYVVPSAAIRSLFAFCTCCECGVMFGLAAGFIRQREHSGKRFYCPNGHEQIFERPKTKAEANGEFPRLAKGGAK
jgi:hypothetical protein